MRKLSVEIPLSFSASNSFNSATGSTTTPLPITANFFFFLIPDGTKCNLYVSPPNLIVWSALLLPE